MALLLKVEWLDCSESGRKTDFVLLVFVPVLFITCSINVTDRKQCKTGLTMTTLMASIYIQLTLVVVRCGFGHGFETERESDCTIEITLSAVK